MQNEQQLLAYFQKAIAKEAADEREKILSEAKEIREAAMDKLRKQASLDAKRQMDKEINEIILENQKEISMMQRKTNLALIAKRQELQEAVFEAAKAALTTYADSSEYMSFLEKNIHALPKEMDDGGLTIRYAAKDEAKFKKLVRLLTNPVTLVADETIQIGGFIAVNEQRGIVADYALDNRLENCKEWFYNHSGLVIQ